MKVNQNKRFVTMSKFQRDTGLSYKTVKNALDTGQLKGIMTEAGHWKIDTHDSDSNRDAANIVARLDEQGQMLKALCGFFKIDYEKSRSQKGEMII